MIEFGNSYYYGVLAAEIIFVYRMDFLNNANYFYYLLYSILLLVIVSLIYTDVWYWEGKMLLLNYSLSNFFVWDILSWF